MFSPQKISILPQLLKVNQDSAVSDKIFLETGKCGWGTEPLVKENWEVSLCDEMCLSEE